MSFSVFLHSNEKAINNNYQPQQTNTYTSYFLYYKFIPYKDFSLFQETQNPFLMQSIINQNAYNMIMTLGGSFLGTYAFYAIQYDHQFDDADKYLPLEKVKIGYLYTSFSMLSSGGLNLISSIFFLLISWNLTSYKQKLDGLSKLGFFFKFDTDFLDITFTYKLD